MDQQQFFTEEELKEYENLISLQENELKKKADELQKQKEELQRQHEQLEAQKLEYHQVVFCISVVALKRILGAMLKAYVFVMYISMYY